MPVRIRLVVAVLTAFVCLVPSAARMAAQTRVTVSGSVVDAALKPIAGAKITVDQAGKEVASTTSDAKGLFRLAIAPGDYNVRAEHAGFPVLTRQLRVPAGATTVPLPLVMSTPQDVVSELKADATTRQAGSAALATPPPAGVAGSTATMAAGRGGGAGGGGGRGGAAIAAEQIAGYQRDYQPAYLPQPGETYSSFDPNRFRATREHPLSTFGADVDTASYTNIRRFLSGGQLPPPEAVRVEELINYFQFNYPTSRDGRPIALTTEIGECPWAPTHKLALIGVRASTAIPREITGRNIVLLIDVSGSMAPQERLPLLKSALAMFVDTLRPSDTLSIVTYAGTSGVALRPTQASRRGIIHDAIASLNAGGSTNGGQGLILAYRIAREAFIPGGVNRVILATDGDFNVGITSQRDLFDLIERERNSGVFLSVFGVGSGNLKDATMEMLADRGNGHYAYLDSLQEARRVLIREGETTLETVAKDVKFQVEFNPAVVSAWKLIGYENRALAARDFNDDRKDAGDIGAGDTVTVLYELVPVGADRREDAERGRPDVDPLKYQSAPRSPEPVASSPTRNTGEWFTVKARYKLPDEERSDLVSVAVRDGGRAQHLPLASAIAEYGLLLRDSPGNQARWDQLLRRVDRLSVPAGQTSDVDGFKELVAIARGLARAR